MSAFKRLLVELVTVRLKAKGYEYDDTLRDRDLVYGFRKPLEGGIHALILFQRRQAHGRPVGYGFTVNLVRSKTESADQRHRGGYAGFLNQRLGAVLHFVYGIGGISSGDQWWDPVDEHQLAAELADAVDKLEEYAIPWIDDLDARMPDLSDAQIERFHEGLLRVVSPEMRELGYVMTGCMTRASFYFGKEAPDQSTSFIVFELAGWPPDFQKLVFDVLLLRGRSKEPRFVISPGMPFQSIGVLLWQQCGLMKGEYRYYDWEYSDDEELEQQLEDAIEKVKSVAVPWLENQLL